jgi:hypothetical protein
MKATAAVPAHDDHAALVLRALPNPEKGVHAELLHVLDVEHVDGDAELLQVAGPAGEFLGVKDVGGLVDEIARDRHAVRHGSSRDVGLLHSRDARDCDRDLDLGGLVLVVLALGLVALEAIGAQLHAERDIGYSIRLDAAARQIGQDGRRARRGRNPAHHHPAKLDEILRLEVAGLADPDDDEARHVEPGRRHDIQRRTVLALEPVGLGRPRDQIPGRLDRLARGGRELDSVFAEQHQNPLRGGRKRGKLELQGAGHGSMVPLGREARI